MLPIQRYKLTIAYDGTHFHGWQRQDPPDGPALRTVQGVMEHKLMRLLKQPVNVVGASRTDAGVHAMGQVAHLDAATRIPKERIGKAINNCMPDDIAVRSVEAVVSNFDAIRDAVHKQYRYRICCASQKPLFTRNQVYWYPHELDVEQMNLAAKKLIGERDFAGLAALNHGRQTTVRTIFDCHCFREGDDIYISVEGSGFLYNMVRIIAGTLLEVGRGHFALDQIDRILETADRRHAGPTLLPMGLCLMWIRHHTHPLMP